MSMNTGENEQGLRKIIDLTRMISICLLLLHFYFYCYESFSHWNLTAKTILSVDEWKKLFQEVGYTGDYFWFIP